MCCNETEWDIMCALKSSVPLKILFQIVWTTMKMFTLLPRSTKVGGGAPWGFVCLLVWYFSVFQRIIQGQGLFQFCLQVVSSHDHKIITAAPAITARCSHSQWRKKKRSILWILLADQTNSFRRAFTSRVNESWRPSQYFEKSQR